MNQSADDMERIDHLLLDGKQRRELAKEVGRLQRRSQTNAILGVMFLLLGAYKSYLFFKHDLMVTIAGHEVVSYDGFSNLLLAIAMLVAGLRVIRPPLNDRVLLMLAERMLHADKQERSN